MIFLLQNVTYKGIKLEKMTLRLLNNQEFIVVDRKFNKEYKGKISEPVVTGDATFTLAGLPEKASYDINYDMKILPMHEALDHVGKGFEIKIEKEEPDVLSLKFSSISQDTSQRF
jgi:hypothetical protein